MQDITARCHNSTKLIGSLLCRHLITARKYELWYTFATHPLRFSLDEFHSITGLNCGAFNVEDSDSEEAAGSVMWQKLFDTTVGDITVAKVLEMLRNPFLAGWKRLPLILIALVDGVLCCTNKNLKLTPKYVEMLTNVPSFLNYPWGRLSFLYTLSRFLPPPVSKDIPDRCTNCGSALQLLAFEVVPQLLARIPDAPNIATFLEDPSACATTVIILNTKDILAVEAEPDVTVHFSLIPEAERHMWLDEVEDLQVDRLISEVERSLFVVEGNNPKNTPLPPEEKPEVVPIIQRNLRPRKPAAIVVEDVTSSEHNKPEVPHQSGSSPDKDLKLWLSEQLQNMARGNYERLETMERNICFHLGVSPPNVHNTRKRKADDDSPKTGGIQAQWPPCKSRRTNSTFTKPTTKIHSYPQRSADRLQENIGLTPPYFNKESRDDNDCAHDRTPPFDEHVNYQEPRTPYAVPDEANAENPITTITIYNPLIFVRPQSYVSPTKSVIDELPCISYLTPTKRFGDEIPVTVTWEETNPHAYTSGKIAPATDVETLSRDVSATKTQSAAVTEGASRDSVAVGNERSPVEEDENYESCQENISIDTLLQEKHHLAVETLPGPDTDEDDNSVESGGKRVRKKSQKIRGVYTPDARLKGLFMSEKKTECMPLPKTSRAIFKKFSDILSENLVQQFEIKTSHIVTNSFFLDIATPGKWTSDECTKSVKECAFTHGIGLKESITTRGVVIVRLEPLSLWRCIVMVMGKKR
uniref:DUF1985 domain-containing protein n=1 Tax=Brassica oleracea TaxID=3712 RepID=A0A3P6BWS7_BRAOL|nr:unnamed protein product [Brassica oleracea]